MFNNLPLLYDFNIAVSWGLFLLIWIVQIIIYPGFIRIPLEDFISYHRWYATRIACIVVPLMICEVIITIVLIILDNDAFFSIISIFLIIIIWLSTFGLQVPIHKQLQTGKDEACIKRLVTTNWIRTIAWSLKAIWVTIGAGKSVF
ncbi:MAG: hypothetical protein PVG35_14820 [Desulfobacterales bacterium]|jgi:hypothetical protein